MSTAALLPQAAFPGAMFSDVAQRELAKLTHARKLEIISEKLYDERANQIIQREFSGSDKPHQSSWIPFHLQGYSDFFILLDPDVAGAGVRVSCIDDQQARDEATVPIPAAWRLPEGAGYHYFRCLGAEPESEIPVPQHFTEACSAIGACLLPPAISTLYTGAINRAKSDNRGIRIVLRVHKDLADIPWEAARFEDRHLCTQIKSPIVREPIAPLAKRKIELKIPVKILALVSQPQGHGKLEVELEKAAIKEAFADMLQSNTVEIRWLEKTPGLSQIQALALALKGNNVFHFIGHGRYNRQAHTGELLFEKADGQPDPVPATDLAQILEDAGIRFAFLNACESGATTGPGALPDVLVRAGIDTVVGMRRRIADDAACSLAKAFYSFLCSGFPIEAALSSARRQLQLELRERDPNRCDWVDAIVYSQALDGWLIRR
ncbi:MAG: CHAT domain-containing protein [Planctomycetes bacterium]|nr:CHAT domain-containing protein [Planctomycetota bacterium]